MSCVHAGCSNDSIHGALRTGPQKIEKFIVYFIHLHRKGPHQRFGLLTACFILLVVCLSISFSIILSLHMLQTQPQLSLPSYMWQHVPQNQLVVENIFIVQFSNSKSNLHKGSLEINGFLCPKEAYRYKSTGLPVKEMQFTLPIIIVVLTE